MNYRNKIKFIEILEQKQTPFDNNQKVFLS